MAATRHDAYDAAARAGVSNDARKSSYTGARAVFPRITGTFRLYT